MRRYQGEGNGGFIYWARSGPPAARRRYTRERISYWLCRPAALELRDRRTSEMQYVCDAPNGKAWFRIETEVEAMHESRLMSHTVEKYFRREREKAVQSWRPERPKAI